MAITDLIPWKKKDANVSVQREQDEDTLLDLRSQWKTTRSMLPSNEAY